MKSNRVILVLVLQSLSFVVKSQTLPSANITLNDGLPSNSIRSIFKDSRGLLWIGTEGGLCCYDGINYKVYNETNGLKYNAVWAITEDNKNNLWLSIYGKGLASFDGKKFTYFDKTNGLANNSVRKLFYSVKHQCLIIATENGLSLFDGKKFKSFNRNDKLNHPFQIVGIDEWNEKVLITTRYQGVFELKFSFNDIAHFLQSHKISPCSLVDYTEHGLHFFDSVAPFVIDN